MKNINGQTIDKVKKYLTHTDNILIITHYNPDGDAIGSSLALYLFFKKKGYNVTVIVPNAYPDFLQWLPGSKDIIIYDENKNLSNRKIEKSNLIFYLDFNAPERLQEMEFLTTDTDAKKVLIDHHPNPGNFTDVVISTIEVSSTSELIYEFLTKIGVEEDIDQTISECLYVGIMTDTGSFSYNSSLPDTYYVVSKLIENEIDKDKIYWKVYDNYTVDRMRLLGYCLNKKLKVYSEYGAAFISIAAKELEEYNFVPGDTEGFVNYPLSIKGIVFSVIFIEKEDQVKISFRSKGEFHANEFAGKHFNGGGHRNAAGGYSETTLKETLDKFVSLLPEYKNEIIKHRI